MKGFSFSSLDRLFAHARARSKDRERIDLIRSQQNIEKELQPKYTLKDVSFNNETRVAKVTIDITKKYRTIEKYITRNYTRYPIYSEWKTRNKRIFKTIKLTNKDLEELNNSEDELISLLSEDIILSIGDNSLIPSWLHKKWLKQEYSEQVKILDAQIHELKKDFAAFVSKNKKNIDNIDKEIAHKNADNTILCAQIKKYDIKIERIRTRKKSTFLNIITFNIYNALSSQKRIEKLETRKNNLQESVSFNSKSIKNLTVQKISEQQTVADKKLVLDNNISSIERDKQNLFDNLGLALQKVIPLPFNIPAEQFIPLSSLAGMQQEKIVGCYIIRNRKNAKCYVGQSKDVLKRLRQHFKGTSPQNIIFSEDYFSTAPEERQSLFEFKIIPLSTKDELDKTEKDLIEAYAAFTHGYNKTNGNS